MSEKNYKGMIIEESLSDSKAFEQLKVLDVKVTNVGRPIDGWHIYTVLAPFDLILGLQKQLRDGKWYMHFWSGDEMIIFFRQKIFKMSKQDKNTWQEAIEFGLQVGIPREQLDFVVT